MIALAAILAVASMSHLSVADELSELSIETLQSKIVKYSPASDSNSVSHFYLESEGRVARITADQPSVFEKLERAYFNNEIVTIRLKDLGDRDEVISLESSDSEILEPSLEDSELATSVYRASDLGVYQDAQNVFAGLHRSFKRRSQCYQRAHVWAFQMDQLANIKSMKVFLFFTERYIRTYNYKWWFHVAPFVYAGGVEYVMDRSYTPKPIPMQNWTNEFIKNKAVCPVIRNYTDYSRNEYAQYCYLAKVPMYYYNPVDLQRLERSLEITDWRASHVNDSRRAIRR